ncbi:MAG: phosphopantothenoylcysteine decarboxylase [Phycisphaerae bacterium]|nr:phosphopantothenoylcysteine decarboxylase [Phycisphaerae bacterium]
MNLLITTGPTREFIDTVRFLSNPSSGRMGCAIAMAARTAGHDVTLLHGPIDESVLGSLPEDDGCRLIPFTSVADLQQSLAEQFSTCDALVMAAAVGDFTVSNPLTTKLRRADGAITLELIPTPDVLATVAAGKRADQKIVAFAVEDPPLKAAEAKARAELQIKRADFVVVNTPAAFGAPKSQACILSVDTMLLSWETRTKRQLADRILRLLETA